MPTVWTTRVPPEATAPFGCAELHASVFQPVRDRGGHCPAMVIEIPETPLHKVNIALAAADRLGARLLFLCDTAAQAEEAAALAARHLPRHRRIALERAAAGGFGPAA